MFQTYCRNEQFRPFEGIVVASSTDIHEVFSSNNRLSEVYDVPSQILQSILELQGKWEDNQVLIWGNGPTAQNALRDRPWNNTVKHIGTNAATQLSGLNFDLYCVGDKRFFEEEWKATIARTAPGVRVYQSTVREEMNNDPTTNFIRTIGRDGFCSNLTYGIYHGYSVVWLALQVAIWCGSTDILLAGCSHDYSGDRKRFYAEETPQNYDGNTERILANYRKLMPIFGREGISLRTIGPSRLKEAGVPMQ
jgi:hypothetical protein